MPSIPSIQIRQQSALLGIGRMPGGLEIRQPRADLEIRSAPAKLDIRSPAGELNIDQSKAYAALNGGNPLSLNQRIYDQMKGIFLTNLAHRVEKGNRLAAFYKPGNTIGDLAAEEALEPRPSPEYMGTASYDNVDIRYTAHPPQINVIPGNTEIEVHPNPPQMTYHPWKIEFYMLRDPKVEIIPPKIDVQV